MLLLKPATDAIQPWRLYCDLQLNSSLYCTIDLVVIISLEFESWESKRNLALWTTDVQDFWGCFIVVQNQRKERSCSGMCVRDGSG